MIKINIDKKEAADDVRILINGVELDATKISKKNVHDLFGKIIEDEHILMLLIMKFRRRYPDDEEMYGEMMNRHQLVVEKIRAAEKSVIKMFLGEEL